MGTLLRTILLGIATGSIYALAATGLVLTYRASGVLNFGYGALALFASFIHWQFTSVWGMPMWLSAILVVGVAAPLMGVILDRGLFARIQGQPTVIVIIATVGLWVLLQGLVFLIWGSETRTIASIFPRGRVPLPGRAFIGVDQIMITVVAGASAVGLGAMLRYTRIGVAFRAVVDNRAVAGLMSVNTARVSSAAWALGTAFAALTGILLTPSLLISPTLLPPFVISWVLGAAVVGYMRSLPLAYAGGLALGVVEALVKQASFSGLLVNLRTAIPFIVVAGFVLFAPRSLRLAAIGASFVVRAREIPAAPPRARRAGGAATFAALALVPAVTAGSVSWTFFTTVGMIYAIVFLSIVVLTGYSGQISLGHSAFMGIAAYTAAHLLGDVGIPMWPAMALGALAAVPAGAIVGAVAIRLHGLYLALVTLAFAFMAHELFFKDPGISGGESGIPLPRPPGATGDVAFYFLVLATLLAFTLLAMSLRTGRTGRVLAAIRDSETGARSLGIAVTKYKIVIFALSAFIAGLGGILLGMVLETVTVQSHIPFLSLIYVTLAVVGGVFHIGGAIASGLLFGLYPQIAETVPALGRIQFILFGFGATIALARNPEGMFGLIRMAAGAARERWAARRAGLPAPVAGGSK